MDIFLKCIESIGANVPAWVPLIVCPALLIVTAALFAALGWRRAYAPVAAAFGGVAFFLICCMEELQTAFLFSGLYVAAACLFRLLFLIPRAGGQTRGARREKRDREIYERFREELPAPPPEEPPADDGAPVATAEESGMRLGHVLALLGKLKKERLSPTDRLEVDALSRTVDAYRNKPLTAGELRTLNDCLASVLKLTAKYKL